MKNRMISGKSICMEFHANQIINFSENNTNYTEDLITFFVNWNPPEIFYFGSSLNATIFCGTLVKILAKLGQQYKYR